MTKEEAVVMAPKIFGRDVAIYEKACVALFSRDPGNAVPDRLRDPMGQVLCSAAPLHGPGCNGGLAVCSVEKPNPAGTERQILALGNNWDEIFGRFVTGRA